MTEGYYFTLPPSEVKRIIFISGALFAVGGLLAGIRGLDVIAFLVLLHVGGYILLRKHKYVFVSPEGIRGEGTTGRNVFFAWSEPVEITEHPQFGISGYAIATVGTKLLLSSIFVPKAIFLSPQFRTIVAKWAPSNHALLSYSIYQP
jgi:hypothetical protein